MKMKIAVDGQLPLAREKTGIGWYSYRMMNAMLRQKQAEFRVDYFENPAGRLDPAALAAFRCAGCEINGCPAFSAQHYKAACAFLPLRHRWFFGGDGDVQVHHFFNYFVPPRLDARTTVTATVYDAAFRAYPESVPAKTRALMALSLEKTCRRAAALVTVSEFSKNELVKYLGVPPEKITVAYGGVDRSVFRPGYPEEEIRRVTERLGIGRDYFLYLGTLEPRKNLVRLLEAYALLKERRRDPPMLVLAGGKGWMYGDIFRRVRELNLSGDVVFTGYVPEEDKPLLLNGALAFVFVSLYEGFGIPPLEAMACGTPVLLSRCSSLPEVAGEAALYADPLDADSVACGMARLMDDDALRAALSAKGAERAARFSWDASASVLLGLFRRLCEEREGSP